jgi:hypothetical protein
VVSEDDVRVAEISFHKEILLRVDEYEGHCRAAIQVFASNVAVHGLERTLDGLLVGFSAWRLFC